jgi:hypothetical protein
MLSQISTQEFFRTNLIPLFQNVIIPNISINEDDIDEFNDEPETYIKNDLEESDTDTRRRLCNKFV